MNWKLCLGLACVAISASQAAAPSKVELVSAPFVTPGQTVAGNGASTGSVVSGDGRIVAFTSGANNLTTNDLAGGVLGGYLDVFARSLPGGPTRLISVNPAGTSSGNGDSFLAGVSRDGRRIVFESDASDLVPVDRNGARDVFVRDQDRGVTLLVSANTAGNGSGNGESSNASISRDGRFVVFESDATDLVTGDTNNVRDVFVRDLAAGITTLVSRGANGLAFANGASDSALISDDGSVVIFSSAASNLAAGDTNKLADVFARDLRTATNVNLTGALRAFTTAGSESYQFALSADGRRVVFQAGDGATLGRNVDDGVIYRRDLEHATNAVVARLNTNLSHGAAESLDVSADGRHIIYGLNGVIYRADSETGNTEEVAVDYTGTNPVMTPDGRWVAFLGMRVATGGPVPGDLEAQVYVRDMSTNVIKRASTRQDGGASTGNDIAIPTLSDDGRWLAFESNDAQIVPGDVNRAYDVFLRDTEGGLTTLVSVAQTGIVSVTGNGSSRFEPAAASADGRYLIYSSLVENLVANDMNGLNDVFLFDRERRTNLLVSVNQSGSGSANGNSSGAILSANGTVAGFWSTASNLTAGKTNNASDFYVRDLARGVTTRIDPLRFPGSPIATAISLPALSADGRYLAFAKGDTVYRLDLSNDTATNVFRAGSGLALAVSGDGRWVAVAGSLAQVQLWDANTGVATRVGSLTPGATVDSFQFSAGGGALFYGHQQGGGYQVTAVDLPGLGTRPLALNRTGQPQASVARPDLSGSADGNRVAFVSTDDSMTAGDTNKLRDIFVRDRRAGTNILVSVNAAGTSSGNGLSDNPRLSADGRFVLFRSEATDLVPGEDIPAAAIFLRDLETGVTRLVSRNVTGTGGPSLRAATPLLSADGAVAYFTSLADNLVAGDVNTQTDVFDVRLDPPPVVVTDSDNDGMPDDWERQYFEDLTHTGTGDFDHDGLRDRDEFMAGTNPASAASTLRIELIRQGEVEWSLRWASVSGKVYRVQYRFTLDGGAWTDLAGETTGTGAALTVALPAVIDDVGRYFRLVVR